jgi:hypothetical protein
MPEAPAELTWLACVAAQFSGNLLKAFDEDETNMLPREEMHRINKNIINNLNLLTFEPHICLCKYTNKELAEALLEAKKSELPLPIHHTGAGGGT